MTPEDNCALLGYYAVRSDNYLPGTTYGVSHHYLDPWGLNMGAIVCSETSVRNYQYTLLNSSKERSYPLLRSWRPNHSEIQSKLSHTLPQSCLKIHFWRVRKHSMGTIDCVMPFCLGVWPPAWNNSGSVGRFLWNKFSVYFFENLSRRLSSITTWQE